MRIREQVCTRAIRAYFTCILFYISAHSYFCVLLQYTRNSRSPSKVLISTSRV